VPEQRQKLVRAGLTAFLTLSFIAPAIAGDLTVTVLDGDGAPVADAVVTVTAKNGTMEKPVPAAEPYTVNQKDTAYDPFVSIVPAGASVSFINSDSWGHHVYSFSKAKRFDITVPAEQVSTPIAFATPGVVVIGCNIHDRMLAYIFVNGDGLPSKSDKSGSARFSGLPAGEYSATAWHPSLRSKRKLPAIEITLAESGETQANLEIALKQQRKTKSKPYKY